ncbi:FkbM family methyltransferase [Rhodoplanes roseus]|nr:FkbM family methyltransferase [Rhodoplanes roseus]
MRSLAEMWSDTLKEFPPVQCDPDPDFFIDFLGVKTRMDYLPQPYLAFKGTVEGRPGLDRAGINDPVEWVGVLRSVAEVQTSFTCIELGAGWAPFAIGSAVAARRRGVRDILLVAVEAARSHVDFAYQHFEDNSFDPKYHRIIHAAVGPYDGTAEFSKISDPSSEWDAEAGFGSYSKTRNSNRAQPTEEVRCISLTSLLREVDRTVDIVHIDIQGAEAAVIEHAANDVDRLVRRMVIGTHGRDIEQTLFEFLDSRGWELELEKACRFQQLSGRAISLFQDGAQVWKNRRFAQN